MSSRIVLEETRNVQANDLTNGQVLDMFLIRLFIYGLLVYLIYRLIRNVFGNLLGERRHPESHLYEPSAKKQKENRDKDDAEIEDAIFEELDEETH
jgi:hypothetical protein